MNVASAVVMLGAILGKLGHTLRNCPSLRRQGRLVPNYGWGALGSLLGLLPEDCRRIVHSRFLRSRRRRMVRVSLVYQLV